MVPNCSRMPTGCEAAMPSAIAVLCLVEAQQARAARGRAQHAGRAGDVPAAVVVIRVHHVAEPAGDVDAEHQRVDHLPPGGAGGFREREDRRGHGTGGMDDGPEVRVVEVEECAS